MSQPRKNQQLPPAAEVPGEKAQSVRLLIAISQPIDPDCFAVVDLIPGSFDRNVAVVPTAALARGVPEHSARACDAGGSHASGCSLTTAVKIVGFGSRRVVFELRPTISGLLKSDARAPAPILRKEFYAGSLERLLNFPNRVSGAANFC